MANRFSDYRPSKAGTFWLCVLCVAATVIIGFNWGGWVSGGVAERRAEQAAHEAYKQVAAAVCVARFKRSPDASALLTEIKGKSVYSRDDVINEGGWAVMPGEDAPTRGVADDCAEQIAKLDSIPQAHAAANPPASESTTVQ
jgi:hypothetical protein